MNEMNVDIVAKEFIDNYIFYVEKIIEFIRKDRMHHITSLTKEYISITTVISEIEISTKYNEEEKTNSIIQLNKSKMAIITHLKKIDSSFTLIKYIPKELIKLEYLYITGTKITNISNTFINLLIASNNLIHN